MMGGMVKRKRRRREGGEAQTETKFPLTTHITSYTK